MGRRVTAVVAFLIVMGMAFTGLMLVSTAGPVLAADGSFDKSTVESTANESPEANNDAVDNDSDDDSPSPAMTITIGGPNETAGNLSEEPIGQVTGIHYNDSIDVNQSDGLSEAELEAYVARSMARTEYLRNLRFTEPISVEVITRETFQANLQNESSSDRRNEWENIIWQALFVVDSDTDVGEEFDTVHGESVAGFYDTSTGNVTIVTEEPDSPVIDNATLVHELLHGLQDQHFNLSEERYTASTLDGELGTLGLIEGDADYAMHRYIEYCETEWQCVKTPRDESSPIDPDDLNMGIWALKFQPYSDGPAYVHEHVTMDGWESIDAKYAEPPTTTREIINRESFDRTPINYSDTATDNWSRYTEFGVNGAERVGEAAVFTMFWYQELEYGVGDFSAETIFTLETHPYSQYQYTGSVSQGWEDDVLVPYVNAETGDHGYVWQIRWEETDQAAQFKQNIDVMLGGHAGSRYDRSTWQVGSGGYDGAYRVHRSERTVTIVFGPDVGALADIRPDIEPERTPPRITDDLLDPVQPVDPVDFSDIEFGSAPDQPPANGSDGDGPSPSLPSLIAIAAFALLALLLGIFGRDHF